MSGKEKEIFIKKKTIGQGISRMTKQLMAITDNYTQTLCN
jgi:hypothetical protein